MTIPGRLIVDSIGLCDGTPAWWQLWLDLVTRSVSVKPNEYDSRESFALAHGTDPHVLHNNCAVWAGWYLPPEAELVVQIDNPNRMLPLQCYPYQSSDPEGPAATDDCSFNADRSETEAELESQARGVRKNVWYQCNGSCAGYNAK